MGLLAHQVEIVDAIVNNSVVSVSAPRRNGKSFAALAGALTIGGRILYVTPGYAAAKHAYEIAQEILYDMRILDYRARNSGAGAWIEYDHGRIDFTACSRNMGRGRDVDTIIIDDAHDVDVPMLTAVHACLFGSRNPRLVALSLMFDSGAAEHLLPRADKVLQWGGATIEEANPALGELFSREQLEFAKSILSPDAFRREHLAISPPAEES